jgi:hypothetical protein
MGPQQSKPVPEPASNDDTTEKTATNENQKQNEKKKVKLVKRAWNCCGVTDFPYTVTPPFCFFYALVFR